MVATRFFYTLLLCLLPSLLIANAGKRHLSWYVAAEGGMASPVNNNAKDVYNTGVRLKLTGGYSFYQWANLSLGVSLKSSLGEHPKAREQNLNTKLRLFSLAAGPLLVYNVQYMPPLLLLFRPYLGWAAVEQTVGATKNTSNELIFVSVAEMRYLITDAFFMYGWVSFGQIQLADKVNTVGLGGGFGVQF